MQEAFVEQQSCSVECWAISAGVPRPAVHSWEWTPQNWTLGMKHCIKQPCPNLRVSPNTMASLPGLEKDSSLCIINNLQLKDNLKF